MLLGICLIFCQFRPCATYKKACISFSFRLGDVPNFVFRGEIRSNVHNITLLTCKLMCHWHNFSQGKASAMEVDKNTHINTCARRHTQTHTPLPNPNIRFLHFFNVFISFTWSFNSGRRQVSRPLFGLNKRTIKKIPDPSPSFIRNGTNCYFPGRVKATQMKK